jgi:hypothetical protein
MKSAGLVFFLSMFSIPSFGYISGIAIQTEKHSQIQVYVNGKLYNKKADNFVRIKSQPGLFHIDVKVFNPLDKKWYMVKNDIRVEKGMEFYYKIVFKKGQHPKLIEVRRYPVYSQYFLNPALYNRHPVS